MKVKNIVKKINYGRMKQDVFVEYPRFSWYLAACQTYQGGTLEEIRE